MNEMEGLRNRYRGDQARRYEQARASKSTWKTENQIIERWVKHGPVLDVPIGTGRYIPHYLAEGIEYVGLDISTDMIAQAKKKDPGVDARAGSILQIPAEDGQFETVVCTRLFNWFDEPDMLKALAECLRVGRRVVFSIRLGRPGSRTNSSTITHGRIALSVALDGWHRSRWEVISTIHRGSYEMWEVRRPTWGDVEAQFRDRRDGPLGTIQRLAGDWAPRMGVDVPDLGPHCDVRAEWWTSGKIKRVLHKAAEADPHMITDKKPRRTNHPLVAFERDGRYGLIDGRRRSNLWQDRPGLYPVLVIPC